MPAASGKTFENRNPADATELIGRFADSGAEDVEKAVAAASAAFPRGAPCPPPSAGRSSTAPRRSSCAARRSSSRDMTREMGKVLDETRGDVQEAIDMTYYMAGEGRRQFGQTTPSELRDKFQMSVRMPVGDRRPHHALELPDGHPLLEDDAGAHPRQHRRHQARDRHPALAS